MPDHAEIVLTSEQLRRELEDLAIRGLRASGAQRLTRLGMLREEFERIGAAHLAQRIRCIIESIESDSPAAAAALLQAHCSLRLFQRILTLEVASEQLQMLQSCAAAEDDA